MKTYQLFQIEDFPEIALGKPNTRKIQVDMFGDKQEIETTLYMQNPEFSKGIQQLRITSQVKHNAHGIFRTVIESRAETLEFLEYLEPVDFLSYYVPKKKLLVMQAPKLTCRGVVKNLKETKGTKIAELKVSFDKIMTLQDEYAGAYFRELTSRVKAAGLHGDQIQDDQLFKNFLKIGKLSCVIIPWKIGSLDTKVMITAVGGVVLTQEFGSLQKELELVLDVHKQLLVKIVKPVSKKKFDQNIGVDLETMFDD
ncbi:MAG: hypothetical protein JNJ77_09525 [Planctomycetia bacterium]|nr:hypothetical protein [Planctomycetia bacterium]